MLRLHTKTACSALGPRAPGRVLATSDKRGVLTCVNHLNLLLGREKMLFGPRRVVHSRFGTNRSYDCSAAKLCSLPPSLRLSILYVPNGLGRMTPTQARRLTFRFPSLPPSVPLQAIDIWMGACTAFIFAALLEFTLTNYLWRKGRKGHTTSSR